jgi:hypothetical protein
MIGGSFGGVLGESVAAGNHNAESDRDCGVCEARRPAKVGGDVKKKTASRIDVR